MTNYSDEFVKDVLARNGLSNILEIPMFHNNYMKYVFTRYFLGSNVHILNETFQKKISLSLEDMLISCTYNFIGCNHLNFTWFHDVLLGSCYSFNSVPNIELNATKAGSINGKY